jgi:DTW domain-containing protein YfiP
LAQQLEPLCLRADATEAEGVQRAHQSVESEVPSASRTWRCAGCWLFRERCICKAVPQLHTRNRIVVWLHVKEYLNSSNTAKLLSCCMPNVERLIFGLRAHEQRLIEIAGQASICLYPAKHSVSVHDAVAELAARGHAEQGLTIIVLDGTWPQARTMARRLPKHVPLVRLTTDHVSAFNTLRRQAGHGRISTCEAVALLLAELGEAELMQPLDHAMRLHVASFKEFAQTHKAKRPSAK